MWISRKGQEYPNKRPRSFFFFIGISRNGIVYTGAARLRLINLFLSGITKVDSFPLTRSGISSANCSGICRGIHSCEILPAERTARNRKISHFRKIRFVAKNILARKIGNRLASFYPHPSLCHRVSARRNER